MKKRIGHHCATTLLTAIIAGLLLPSSSFADPEEELQAGIDAFNQGDLLGAMAHYRVAADAGLATAQIKLAYILDYSGDDVGAVRLYRAAADQNHADGYFGLGEMYAKGEGAEQDYEQSVEFFTVAANNGSLRAVGLLTRAYKSGDLGLPIDMNLAGRWLIRGAEIGNPDAMRELTAAYEKGLYGLQPNAERATYWRDRLRMEFTDND